MQDLRKHKRIRSIKGARAIVAASGTGFDCVIRDISGAGARIVFDDVTTLGQRFHLHITKENKTLEVSTSWQRGCQAGVSFNEKLKWIDRHVAA
ncbi:MAG TPA: PilZ domain-containing protein [Afifellaceae bacterium]|nr:PilZ domain-containing protein [Afifellaceae bacterium]